MIFPSRYLHLWLGHSMANCECHNQMVSTWKTWIPRTSFLRDPEVHGVSLQRAGDTAATLVSLQQLGISADGGAKAGFFQVSTSSQQPLKS